MEHVHTQQEYNNRELWGDSIIPDPEAAWDTLVSTPGHVDDAWEWFRRIGFGEEGGAGWLLPSRLDKWIPGQYRSVQGDLEAFRQLQVGNEVKDGPHSTAQVIFIDSEGPTKSMVLESQWPDKHGRPGIHYTWQVVLEANAEGGTDILARTRMANLKHVRLTQKFGPHLDQKAMKLMGEGLAERITSGDRASDIADTKDKRDQRLVVASTVAGWLAMRELTKRSSSASIRKLAPAVGALVAFGLSRKHSEK